MKLSNKPQQKMFSYEGGLEGGKAWGQLVNTANKSATGQTKMMLNNSLSALVARRRSKIPKPLNQDLITILYIVSENFCRSAAQSVKKPIVCNAQRRPPLGQPPSRGEAKAGGPGLPQAIVPSLSPGPHDRQKVATVLIRFLFSVNSGVYISSRQNLQ